MISFLKRKKEREQKTKKQHITVIFLIKKTNKQCFAFDFFPFFSFLF
jgi:hypothetical protein